MSERVVSGLALGARGLAVGYGARSVLRDVDLEVRTGEFWFLLGANGSGKSTLMGAFLGLVSPQAGEITHHLEPAGREHLGFVPQRCDFDPSLPTTVREFVSLGLVGARRLSRAERLERIAWALAGTGLRGLEEASYWSLSGGQRQRALVARALVRRPCLMMLDEPTEGLDPAFEDALLDTLARLNTEEDMTILFITHKLSIAARYASHVALLHSGTAHVGPREVILVPEALERAYGAAVELEADVAS